MKKEESPEAPASSTHYRTIAVNILAQWLAGVVEAAPVSSLQNMKTGTEWPEENEKFIRRGATAARLAYTGDALIFSR